MITSFSHDDRNAGPSNKELLIHFLFEQPFFYILQAIFLLAIDYTTGPFIQFPISFVIPVALSSWFCGERLGFSLAILQPLIRFILSFQWQHQPNFYWNVEMQATNALIRIIVLVLLAYFISRTVRQSRELARRVRLFSGLLPICFKCKKIQDEHQLWQEIDLYLSIHSELQFNPTLCPHCKNSHFADVVDKP